MASHDRILIIDFGAQYTQLIARRVREAGVYCEIHPYNKVTEASLKDFAPKGIILSGGPASVTEKASPRAPDAVFTQGLPVLGICYGQQTMVEQLGGKVESSDHKEFGRAAIDITGGCKLFDGLWAKGAREQVWMSHGDRVVSLPAGFQVVAVSEGAPFAAIADEARKFYAVQFHPEVVHTPGGAALLKRFAREICGTKGDWTMAAFRAEAIARIKAQVGKGRVICGLSGGVDSSVVAALIHEAIGSQLTCVLVDHGLMRGGECENVVRLFRDRFNITLVHRDAQHNPVPSPPGFAGGEGTGTGPPHKGRP